MYLLSMKIYSSHIYTVGQNIPYNFKYSINVYVCISVFFILYRHNILCNNNNNNNKNSSNKIFGTHIQFFEDLFIFYVYELVLPLHMCVFHIHSLCLYRPKEYVRYPGTEVPDGCVRYDVGTVEGIPSLSNKSKCS